MNCPHADQSTPWNFVRQAVIVYVSLPSLLPIHALR
jgi:hypothetical protein